MYGGGGEEQGQSPTVKMYLPTQREAALEDFTIVWNGGSTG